MPKIMWPFRTILKILAIIVLASQPSTARKHWKRAPVRGAFNVDLYAYNKPVVNLAGQQTNGNGVALPMGQLLEQLSHSSRRLGGELSMSMQKSNYRNLDTDNYMARNQGVAAVAALATDSEANATAVADQIIAQQKQSAENLGANNLAINRQLAELQMNFSLENTHEMRNLYSHEFHVQNMGKRKIVQLNQLRNDTEAGKDRKPERAEIMSEPLNLKLELPALGEEEEEEENELEEDQEEEQQEPELSQGQEQEKELNKKLTETATSKVIENWSTLELPLKADSTEAISTFQQMQRNEETTTEMQSNKSQVSQQLTSDSKQGPKHMTTIEAPNTANAYGKEKERESERERETETNNDANDAKKNDSRYDIDGQVSGTPQSVAVTLPAPLPLPVPATVSVSVPKPKRRKIKTKAKKPNEIDTKPTSSSSRDRLSLSSGSTLMIGMANAKAPVKESPEITHTPVLNSQDVKKMGKGKGQGKRKGSQQEQEIETTTNWWHILPYAEIRKFLNTIYDTITDDDEERRQRHRRRAQRI